MERNHWRGDYNGEINGGGTKWDGAELRNPTGKTIGGLWGGGGDGDGQRVWGGKGFADPRHY